MTDRQKTVEELGFVREHFLYQVEETDQQHKQYYIRLGNIVLDAINLLKEQEAKPTLTAGTNEIPLKW